MIIISFYDVFIIKSIELTSISLLLFQLLLEEEVEKDKRNQTKMEQKWRRQKLSTPKIEIYHRWQVTLPPAVGIGLTGESGQKSTDNGRLPLPPTVVLGQLWHFVDRTLLWTIGLNLPPAIGPDCKEQCIFFRLLNVIFHHFLGIIQFLGQRRIIGGENWT